MQNHEIEALDYTNLFRAYGASRSSKTTSSSSGCSSARFFPFFLRFGKSPQSVWYVVITILITRGDDVRTRQYSTREQKQWAYIVSLDLSHALQFVRAMVDMDSEQALLRPLYDFCLPLDNGGQRVRIEDTRKWITCWSKAAGATMSVP